MTLRAAHHFIAALRADPLLRERVPPPASHDGLDRLLDVACELGHDVGADELRIAHRQHAALSAIAAAMGTGKRESSAAASAE